MENKTEQAVAEQIAEQLAKQGKAELIIRKGEAAKLYDPERIEIKGNIDSPARWLEKRHTEIDQKTAHVIVNRDAMVILLITEETSKFKTQVAGQLQISTELRKFGINTGDYISNFDMADRIKLLRSYFETQSQAMKLVTELRNFKAKVDREIELSDDKRGNARQLRSQIVESNLPDKFNINVPVFKGQDKQTIEVEVEINPTDLSCTLVSPEANDIVTTKRDELMDAVIEAIKETCPEIVIIEE